MKSGPRELPDSNFTQLDLLKNGNDISLDESKISHCSMTKSLHLLVFTIPHYKSRPSHCENI